MAIFHLKVSTISRAAGQSAVAASAYRACSNMTDLRTGQPASYGRKTGHLAGGLVGWNGTIEELWNTAEAAERRKDALLAREVILALPAELSPAERERLVRGFAEILAGRHKLAVQWDLHAPTKQGDDRNFHAHLLITTRRVEAGRLGDKARELDVKPTSGQHIKAWRQDWQDRVNAELEKAGSSARIDSRSHAQRWAEDGLLGEAPEPMAHLGPARTAAERRGRRTRAGKYNDSRKEAARLQKQIGALDRQIAHLRRPDHPSKATLHAGRAVRASSRLVGWAIGATVTTTFNLAGAKLRRTRLPARTLNIAVASTASLAVDVGRMIARAIRRWRDRRKVPAEMRNYWRATASQSPAEIGKLRHEAFAALARRYPDQTERWAALRTAEAALPRALRMRLTEAIKSAKEAKLAALSRAAVDRATQALTDAAGPRLVMAAKPIPPPKVQTFLRPPSGRKPPPPLRQRQRPLSRRPRDRDGPER